MKKIINILLIALFGIGLSSCYQDLKKDSLDEYIKNILVCQRFSRDTKRSQPTKNKEERKNFALLAKNIQLILPLWVDKILSVNPFLRERREYSPARGIRLSYRAECPPRAQAFHQGNSGRVFPLWFC